MMIERTGRILIGLVAVIAMVAMSLSAGCSDDVNNIILPGDGLDVTLSAQVLSYPDGSPIAGATYEVVQSDLLGTTGDDGYFSVDGLSRGNYLVRVSATEHHTTLLHLAVDPEDKDQGLHLQTTIMLMESAGRLQLLVLGQPGGEPLAGVPVQLMGCTFPQGRWPQSLDNPQLSGVTDEDGRVTLAGLPVAHVSLRVGGLDADDNGVDEFAAAIVNIMIADGQVTESTAVLSPPVPAEQDLNVIATNRPAYNGALLAESLYFVFSDSMTTWNATLVTDDYPYTEIGLTGVWVSPLRLELTPVDGLLGPAVDYDLELVAVASSGAVYQENTRFYWQQPTGGSGGECDDIVSDLHLSSVAAVDYDTQSLTVAWTAVPCAGGYDVYARDDRDNPNWVHLVRNPLDYETGLIEQPLTLPSSFDRYGADGRQTPFAGTAVSICVVPARASDPMPGDEHAVIVIEDAVSPSLSGQYADGIFNNTTDSQQRGWMFAVFSEYLAPDTVAPTLEVREAGGDPAYLLDPSQATWTWDPGMRSGRFSILLAPGVDASLDEFRIVCGPVSDQTGNTSPGSITGGWQLLVPLPPVWDFEDGPQGWTCADGHWEWGAPNDGPYSGHDSEHCWGTNLNGYYDYNWDTRMVSPEFVVPVGNAHVGFWYYSDIASGDYFDVIVIGSGGESIVEHIQEDYSAWRNTSISLADFGGQLVRLAFRFYSNGSSNDNGVFIDDVEVSGD
jgi:hypothetical protein